MNKHVVIIGNGISGVTAARHLRKGSDHAITIISAETDHFFSRTALMYIFMGHMEYANTKPYEDSFWSKNRIDLKRAYVERIDAQNKQLQLSGGETMGYDVLILAVGSKSNKFGWPGQDLAGVQGLYSYQALEGMEKYAPTTDKVVIVGGGLIGIEMGEMWMSRGKDVTFLIREPEFWSNVLPMEEAAMVSRHVVEHHAHLYKETNLKEILGDGNGRVKGVVTEDGQTFDCQFVGLTVGVSPNIDFLKGGDIETDRGILVDPCFRTNQPDVYAIGDCAQYREPVPGRRPIEQVWYTGRMHGESVAQTILGNETRYQPGAWFNSAKFMDIEYQVYGEVGNSPKEGEKHLYWERKDGKASIRLIYNAAEGFLIGINLMGIRYRHEVCDRWLRTKVHITEVLANLREANFDPEFFDTYEHHVVALYNAEHPDAPVKLKKKRGLLAGIFG